MGELITMGICGWIMGILLGIHIGRDLDKVLETKKREKVNGKT